MWKRSGVILDKLNQVYRLNVITFSQIEQELTYSFLFTCTGESVSHKSLSAFTSPTNAVCVHVTTITLVDYIMEKKNDVTYAYCKTLSVEIMMVILLRWEKM